MSELANTLGLSQEEAETIERAVMGNIKEQVLPQQLARRRKDQYRREVEAVWIKRKLSEEQVIQLKALANRLGLSQEEAETIERAVMGNAKEVILNYQDAGELQYRRVVEAAWVAKRLTREKVTSLSELANTLGLSQEEVAAIERAVMGNVKETILSYQEAGEQQECRAIEAVRADKQLTQEKVTSLSELASTLGLGQKEAETVESAAVGDGKKSLLQQCERDQQDHTRNEPQPSIVASSGPVTIKPVSAPVRAKRKWRLPRGKVINLIVLVAAVGAVIDNLRTQDTPDAVVFIIVAIICFGVFIYPQKME
ncbi:MAG TPA: hypothetical protein VFV38_28475 [Ktedonobacteraceae bacterium]|nr:hypothetical protein [Ktedonobacteraceae bacterium]